MMKKYIKDISKLASEYCFKKNKDIDFEKITHGSDKKVWWKCSKGHEWEASVSSRSIGGNGCPYCSNRKICKDNCLITTHCDLLKKWNYQRNSISPEEVTSGSSKKVWWKCPRGHEWQVKIRDMTIYKINCPYCSNKKTCKDNCLVTTHSHLLKEWDYNKNKIKPEEITSGSDKKIWWKCKKGHSYKTRMHIKAKGFSCPYCVNRRVSKDNCLNITHPELAKEWSDKNKLKPTDIVSGSKKKAWWKCSKCYHEWNSIVYGRSNGIGCPRCNESKGENKVEKILKKNNVRYKREYNFKNLGKKRFDFALFKKYAKKPWAVIEYHGEQHYVPVRFGGMSLKKATSNFSSCQKRDKIKKKYCIDNNIRYLEISYKEKDNMEKLIKDFLKKNSI